MYFWAKSWDTQSPTVSNFRHSAAETIRSATILHPEEYERGRLGFYRVAHEMTEELSIETMQTIANNE